jgi:hypothetical protein
MVTGQLAPETIADWMLGKQPALVLVALILGGAVVQALLILFTPLPKRILAIALAQAAGTTEQGVEAKLQARADVVSVYRRGLLGRSMRRLVAQSVTFLLIGAFAAGAAWATAMVLNSHRAGFISWMLLIVFGVFWLLFVGVLGAVKETLSDDATRATEAAVARLSVTEK